MIFVWYAVWFLCGYCAALLSVAVIHAVVEYKEWDETDDEIWFGEKSTWRRKIERFLFCRFSVDVSLGGPFYLLPKIYLLTIQAREISFSFLWFHLEINY